jgi:hypothetical protein
MEQYGSIHGGITDVRVWSDVGAALGIALRQKRSGWEKSEGREENGSTTMHA